MSMAAVMVRSSQSDAIRCNTASIAAECRGTSATFGTRTMNSSLFFEHPGVDDVVLAPNLERELVEYGVGASSDDLRPPKPRKGPSWAFFNRVDIGGEVVRDARTWGRANDAGRKRAAGWGVHRDAQSGGDTYGRGRGGHNSKHNFNLREWFAMAQGSRAHLDAGRSFKA